MGNDWAGGRTNDDDERMYESANKTQWITNEHCMLHTLLITDDDDDNDDDDDAAAAAAVAAAAGGFLIKLPSNATNQLLSAGNYFFTRALRGNIVIIF